MGDIKDCVQCMEPVYMNNGIPHWCDRYIMCCACFYDISHPDQEKRSNYIIVRSHPEWTMETWGWKIEKQEIHNEGGTFNGY